MSAEGCTHAIEQIEWQKTDCRDYFVLVDMDAKEVEKSGSKLQIMNYCHKKGITKIFEIKRKKK